MKRLLPIFLMVPLAAAAVEFRGPARVVDGDRLAVAGEQVRLHVDLDDVAP